MSFFRDKQIRSYCFFLLFFSILLFTVTVIFTVNQIGSVKQIYTTHNEAIASSLLKQGVSKEVIAVALTNTETSSAGKDLLSVAGLDAQTANSILPFLSEFQKSSLYKIIVITILLILVLIGGTAVFFRQRKRTYEQAEMVIDNYISGDFSCHLPQNSDGTVFQLFSSIEQLATMLQSKNETERETKEFLKRTISDISHQLKTPLAALNMYQEIISGEPNNAETVKEFSSRIGVSLNRIEQLIQAMLKITRLDTGNIAFEREYCPVEELIALSISELTARAEKENVEIIVEGERHQSIVCDVEWTSEAIGNIVKNALDHSRTGGTIRITWEAAPYMFRILISDDGCGIAQEDIYHIFKRFYRSKNSIQTQGIGLGLSLAKSIVEGQDGIISVQSELNRGTTFILSFLTKL